MINEVAATIVHLRWDRLAAASVSNLRDRQPADFYEANETTRQRDRTEFTIHSSGRRFRVGASSVFAQAANTSLGRRWEEGERKREVRAPRYLSSIISRVGLFVRKGILFRNALPRREIHLSREIIDDLRAKKRSPRSGVKRRVHAPGERATRDSSSSSSLLSISCLSFLSLSPVDDERTENLFTLTDKWHHESVDGLRAGNGPRDDLQLRQVVDEAVRVRHQLPRSHLDLHRYRGLLQDRLDMAKIDKTR